MDVGKRRLRERRAARDSARLSWLVQFAAAVALASVLSPNSWGAAAPNGARELVYQRSATSETFVDDNGVYRTRLFAHPVHYRAGNEWRAIDSTLVPSARSGYALENKANAFQVAFKNSLSGGFLRLDTAGGRSSVAVSLVGGAAVTAQQNASHDGVRYADVLQDTDAVYRVLPTGVKETLILRSAASPSSFEFTLAPLDGNDLRAVKERSGEITFYAVGHPQPAFSIDAPVVADTSLDGSPNPDESGKATVEATKLSDGSFRLTVTIDARWLLDPARTYPLYLDPTYNAVTDLQDGYYNETAGGTPDMTSSTLKVGANSGTGPSYGAAVVFDLATIPLGANVTKVFPNLYLTGCIPGSCTAGTTTGTVEMRQLLSGWTSTTPWSAITKDGVVAASRSFNAGTGGDAINNWYTLTPSSGLVTTAQAMVNGSVANYGFIFEKNGGNGTNGFQFASSRMGDSTFAPYLDVYWTVNGVTLDPSPLLHANGADLTWTRWNGGEGTYASTISADNPALYWRLDESGGPSAFDYTANARNGSYGAGVLRNQPGAIGSNPSVDVSAGKITQSAGSNISLGSFSVELWARRLISGTDDNAVSQGANLTNQGLFVGFTSTDKFRCGFTSNDLDTASTYTDSAWHHWACTYNSTSRQRTIYRDGVQVAQAIAAANYSGSGPVAVGDNAWAKSDAFAGDVDEVAIYTSTLTSTQVQSHYNAGATPLPGFQRYEIHRSTTSGFTPSTATLIGTLTDQALQTFRDTSAKPDSTFYYKILTVTAAASYESNQIKAVLPTSGLAKIAVQPGFVTGAARGTYIVGSSPNSNNRGSLPTMVVDSAPSRALLAFDLRPIPAGVTITSPATLELYTYHPVTATIDVHRLKADWNEGGASWDAPGISSNWATPGGDYDATAAATTTTSGTDPAPRWYSWEVTGLVQNWVNANQTHFGFLLKHHTETGAPSLAWVADGYARSIALRPKLTVLYEDPTATVISPEVGINTPAPDAQVKGTITVKAGASDDSKVTSVQFKLDGNNLGAAVTAAPYETAWDTTTASRGNHTLTAVATDDAGNTTTATAVNVTVANSTAPTVALTTGYQDDVIASGNEITDATRAAGVQGDGRTSPDSSYGIWEGTTNLDSNGGLESNSNGYTVSSTGSPTLTRDNAHPKFGAWSGKLTAGASGAYMALRRIGAMPISGATAGRRYTFSAWIYATGTTVGKTPFLTVWANGGGSPEEGNGDPGPALVSGWQRVSFTLTVVANDRTNLDVELKINTVSAADTVWVDGLQVEQLPFPTPYVETDGATSIRGAARVQANAGLINANQAWVALRLRLGIGSTDTSDRSWFSWRDDDNNRISVGHRSGEANIAALRVSGGTQDIVTTGGAFSSGGLTTVIAAWTSTSLKLSIDSSAFTSVSSTHIPSLAASLFDIGAYSASTGLGDSDVLWIAAGTGTLTDADADTIAAFGNSGPTALSALPGTPSILWGTDTGTYDVSQSSTISLKASASDDYAVSKVEFYADGNLVGSDTTSPFAVGAPTLPLYDGPHAFTAKAFDADGNATTSQAANVTVSNTSGSIYKGTIAASGLPSEMRYDPGGGPQDGAPITVSLTNNSGTTWAASTVKLRYRWLKPDGTELSNSGDISIGSDLASGGNRNVSVTVAPPALPASVMRGRLTLRIDLYSSSASTYFAAKGNQPYELPVTVTRMQLDELGVERYQQYDGTALGSGFGANVNLFNGNLALRSTLSLEPGIGLATAVNLSYNSLESGSESPVGNNWSLSVSGLIPFGLPLDIHPNNADTAAGRTAKWIGFVDGDGTYHRFTLNAGGNFYDPPAGVHLYLRATGSADTNKYWGITKPDRTTYYFDQAGYPTRVEDKDGNALTFTETAVAAGDDAYGLAKQITKVTDQGNRDLIVDYYGKSDTGSPAVRGKVSSITDHIGHSWMFTYYADGNLLRLTESGGKRADGSFLPDRSVTFTYTNPAGNGPAIATLASRQNPDPATVQSSRLYGVIDARGNETQFAYITFGATTWRVSQMTDRSGHSSQYSYDPGTLTTTLTMPISRTWSYVFDAQGRATSIVDPLNGTTAINWTTDDMVQKVTAPTGGTNFVEYAYNQNGYLTDKWDELRNHASLVYENLAVDSNDTILRISRPTSVTQPVGDKTSSKPHDDETRFDYTDTTHDRVWHITDAYDNQVTNTYNTDGTLATQQLPAAGDGITRTTSYTTYDLNGLPTKVTDAAGNIAQSSYNAAGDLLWQQDPNHQAATPGDPGATSRFYYDSFGRPSRSSTPKSSTLSPGLLVWKDAVYDANDNVVQTFSPRYGQADSTAAAPSLPASSTVFDAMDRATLETGPRTASQGGPVSTQTSYDAAGRITSQTAPRGVKTAPSGSQWAHDFETETTYDVLDRAYKTTQYAVDGNGNVDSANTRTTTRCYDLAGDLRTVTGPNGASQISACPPVVAPASYVYTAAQYTTKFVYDAAHRQTQTIDPLGHVSQTGYNEDGEISSSTDANNKVTQYFFDDRGLRTKTVRPFDAASSRTLTEITNYDALGRIASFVSARAYDYTNGTPPFTSYVTSYSYDALNRIVKTAQPKAATETQAFTYQAYDANGNTTQVSLPTTATSLAAVAASDVTTTQYLDTGAISSSLDGSTGLSTHFDYTADGLQAARYPDGTGTPNVIDYTRAMYWAYYPDGVVAAVLDQGGQREVYNYDADGNETLAVETSGATNAAQSPLRIERTFNDFDEPTKTRSPEQGVPNSYYATTYAYDPNGNRSQLVENRKEDTGGTQLIAGRVFTYAYNFADQVTAQTDDFGTPGVANDDEQLAYSYTSTGQLDTRTLSKWTGVWSQEQKVTRTYFDDGELKQLTNYDGTNAILEQHTLAYITGGIYLNGNMTSDTFKLMGPDASAPCRTSTCTASWTYDGRDRLISEDPGTGSGTTNYTLDVIGNAVAEGSTTRTFSGQKLISQTTGGATTKYIYDAFGNVDCIVTSAWAATYCPAAGNANLLEDYTYDYKNRLVGYTKYSGGSLTDSASYTLDALDRTVSEAETHSGTSTTTTSRYVGDSTAVAQEVLTGATNTTKKYAYDAAGERVTLADGANRYSYLYNAQASVSLLINNANAVKSSYGYTAYGSANSATSKVAAGFNAATNSYRYGGSRLDSGSNTYAMGARRYSSGAGRWLQQDAYFGAFTNLGLSRDPLNRNRYAFGGANPINAIETDGHLAMLRAQIADCYYGDPSADYCHSSGSSSTSDTPGERDLNSTDSGDSGESGESGDDAAKRCDITKRLDCPVESFIHASWDQRIAWLDWLNSHWDLGHWLDVFYGVLSYFKESDTFSDSEHMKVADAYTLWAISRGLSLWENHSYGTENESKAALGWRSFFGLLAYQEHGYNITDTELKRAWGEAEQNGINLGLKMSKDVGFESSFERHLFTKFVKITNAYRRALRENKNFHYDGPGIANETHRPDPRSDAYWVGSRACWLEAWERKRPYC